MDDPQPLLRVSTDDQDFMMLHSEPAKEDRDDSEIVGQFIAIMREIQQQEPLDDPNVIFIDKNGTRYY